MSDYQGLIRVGIQGLGQIQQLNTALERTVELYGNLENAQIIAGQIGESAMRNVRRSRLSVRQARQDLRDAVRERAAVAQPRDSSGKYAPGGGTMAQRREAYQRYTEALDRSRVANRNLREEERNRRLIAAAQGRYARALTRTSAVMGRTQNVIDEQQERLELTLRGIEQGARGNYLTNLFQGRQVALTRGGGGRNLPANLQAQIRANRSAWDLATAGGKEDLQLMSKLATELSGLVRQQNEFNRLRAVRSGSYEAARRGQERIDELAMMPGADSAKIRRLRSQATQAAAAGFRGDSAETQLETRRMNASIARYERELKAAAEELNQQRRARFGSFNVAQGWRAISAEAQQLAAMPRALPDAAALARRIARTPGGVAPTRLDKLKKEQETLDERRAKEEAKAAKDRPRRFREKLLAEEKRQERLGIGVALPGRASAPSRRTGAVPMGGGADAGIMPRALPSSTLLAERIARTPGGVAPTRLDKLKKEQETLDEKAARERKRKADRDAADSAARFAAALEREAKRLERLGLGPGTRESRAQTRMSAVAGSTGGGGRGGRRGAAIPMPGEGGGFNRNQYSFPAGPGNEKGIAAFNRLQPKPAKPSPGFFRGNAREAIGDALIGGAFPTLFGQGLGASLGGALGGGLGGAIGGSFGFGLSLVGTAIGQVVDTTVGKLGDLGNALGSASDSIEALEEAGFRVRDSQKIQIAQLEKVGRGYEAQGQALKEIESKLGPGAVAQVERLSEAQKQLSDSWAELSLSIGLTLIPGIAQAVQAINGLLGRQGGGVSGASVGTRRPRKPSELLKDIDASIALNETYKAANKEYAGFLREAEDLRRSNEEKIFAMRRQGADIEKEKSDLRLDVESKIFEMRQEAARAASENARSRGQLGIESLDLALARRSEALGGDAGNFADQIREYLRARGQGELELQNKEKAAKLQRLASERELQQYVLRVADKVASVNRAVEDYKRGQAEFRFELSRRLEDYRIKAEDYIYSRVKERYEYAIGSEREILQIKTRAAAALGASLPIDTGRVLGAAGATTVGPGGLANPLGPQPSGRPPNWNQGLGSGRGHQGQDIGVDVGTTIHAIEDAVVEGIIRGFSRDGNPRAGDAVMLRYLSGQLGVYGHIKPLPGIAPGQRIKAGQQIGTVSDWGKNTHFHYELWKRNRGAGGQLLDPTERLRAAMGGKRMAPAMPATPSQRRSGPAMLLPGVVGPAMQPSVPQTTDSMFDQRRSSARPGIGDQFISLLGGRRESVASASLAGLLAKAPTALPVVPFGQALPSYKPAPAVPQLPPAPPRLPPAPAPMAMPDIAPLTTELGRQRNELLQSVELAEKLQKIEDGRLLLQLVSTREVLGRLDNAAKELALETEIAGLSKSISDDDQGRAIEKARTALAAKDLNDLEKRSLDLTSELLRNGKLRKQEHDEITAGVKARIEYEKDLLQIEKDRAEVARRAAYSQRSGELERSIALTGAGLRSGLVGEPARAFEAEMAISGDSSKAMGLANRTKLLEDQQLVWGGLEKNIVDVSNAISSGLTNGLVDIASGAKRIEDVGRDMLNGIASTFADSAQQQLTTLMQRQLGQLLGGPQGPLVKMLGSGGEAAGAQALGAASGAAAGSLWNVSAAAAAAGSALQAIAAQAAFSGGISAFQRGAAQAGAAGIGQALSSAAPNLFGTAISESIPQVAFGGFLANGGNTRPGEVYVTGEKEPEFFFPGVSGRVVPKSDIEKAAALRQDSADSGPIQISYTVTEQRGERFVTESEFRKGMAATAQRAQAMTYAGMRNNRDVRDYVGV